LSVTLTTATQQKYAEYLRSPRWRLLRTVRRVIDGQRCRTCYSRDHLQVHHASYAHRGRGFFGELRDTITLCDECHRRLHRGRGIVDFA